MIGKDNGCMLPGLCEGNEVRGDRMFRQIPIEAIGRFVGTLFNGLPVFGVVNHHLHLA